MKYKVFAFPNGLRLGCLDIYPCATKEAAKASCAYLEARGYIARFEEVDLYGRPVTDHHRFPI